VRVVDGPFADVEGTVTEHCAAERLILDLEPAQRGVSLEIDECCLALAE
jgi:transcription antitermination factor NusG